MIAGVELDPTARRLQERYGLTVFAVSLDRSDSDPQVVMEVTSAGGGTIERHAMLSCHASEFGLPRHLVDQHVPDTSFALPDYIAHALGKALASEGSVNEPVWIRMAAPVGLLPIVPWERLLAPMTQRPLLRLPYHEISPAVPKRAFDCVICFSSPAAKAKAHLRVNELFSQFLAQVPADLAKHAVIHVFADADVQPTLRSVLAPYAGSFDVRIYDPNESSPADDPSRDEVRRRRRSPSVVNPWLRWIRRSLKRRSADVVHFLCHCYLSGDEGALALAESPTRNVDDESARFVWPDELAAFLDDVGAWSVGLTSPPENYSVTGMRMLQDQIARLRPGPSLVHDMTEPGGERALGEMYRFLYLPEWHPAPHSSAIALYCHPWQQTHDQRADSTSEALLHDVTLAGRLGEEGLARDERGWLSTAQRMLEQSAAHLPSPSVRDEEGQSVDRPAAEAASIAGRKDALRFVADALARYSSSDATSSEAGSAPEQSASPSARKTEA